MTNPELKTVPVAEGWICPGTFLWHTTICQTTYQLYENEAAYLCAQLSAALAASPPPPVAGDEGAEALRKLRWALKEIVEKASLMMTGQVSYVGHIWRVAEMALPHLDKLAPPPPPADLKAEAARVVKELDERGVDFLSECDADAVVEEALTAAHAAGKAEGEAEREHLQEALDDSEAECCQSDDAVAAARAEALEEALAAARAAGEEVCKNFVLIGPSGIVRHMLAAIRALISASLPPREEP